MKVPDFDDKDLVIFATTAIALVAMFKVPDAMGVVSNIVAGLFGVAVGKSIGGNETKKPF